MLQNLSAQASFLPRTSVSAVEEGEGLMPRFDQDGLIVTVVTDAGDGVVLMVGYMNAEALRKTMDTGYAHFWSRSRKKLWRKGETSNLSQKIVELRIDDDQDALWLKVEVGASGASCHVGYRSCFYRRIEPTKQPKDCLQFTERDKTFDPKSVYKGQANPTNL